MATIDVKWFKAKQKEADITTEDIGRRLGKDRSFVSRIYTRRQKMKLDEARVFAEMLGVPMREVMLKAGIVTEEEVPTADSHASGSDVLRISESEIEALQSALSPADSSDDPGNQTSAWKVETDGLVLEGLYRGDRLFVREASRNDVMAGDIVLARVATFASKSTQILLRRYAPPYITASSSNREAQAVHFVDGEKVAILGRVVGVWRDLESGRVTHRG
jgi:SOS-response transcriptional repressor LexA